MVTAPVSGVWPWSRPARTRPERERRADRQDARTVGGRPETADGFRGTIPMALQQDLASHPPRLARGGPSTPAILARPVAPVRRVIADRPEEPSGEGRRFPLSEPPRAHRGQSGAQEFGEPGLAQAERVADGPDLVGRWRAAASAFRKVRTVGTRSSGTPASTASQIA